ncbi:MAG: hypothetical protein P8Y07_08280 [Gemmatimonadales bacterium]
MRGRTSLMLMVGAVALAGCDNTPFGDADKVECTFLGTWTLSWEGIDSFGFPIGDESLCSGSVTLGDQSKDTFGGIFLVLDDGDCDGSPVSGSIVDGFARADGGVNFTMTVPPSAQSDTITSPKSQDDIWEDIFAGTGIVDQNIFSGCRIADADNQMNGAISGSELSASASASLSCEDTVIFLPDGSVVTVSDQLRLLMRFAGDR